MEEIINPVNAKPVNLPAEETPEEKEETRKVIGQDELDGMEIEDIANIIREKPDKCKQLYEEDPEAWMDDVEKGLRSRFISVSQEIDKHNAVDGQESEFFDLVIELAQCIQDYQKIKSEMNINKIIEYNKAYDENHLYEKANVIKTQGQKYAETMAEKDLILIAWRRAYVLFTQHEAIAFVSRSLHNNLIQTIGKFKDMADTAVAELGLEKA